MKDQVAEIIREFADIKPEDIKEDSNLRFDLGLNSLDLINIAVEIENKLGVSIEDSKLKTLITVGDLIACAECAA